jgi:hypothetical protein
MTIGELQEQIDDLMRQIASLQAGLGPESMYGNSLRDPYQEENERMERYLSEFTVRQGALLTIAGLLSMLPLSSEEHLRQFLIFSFPFLVAAITCYILSSKRINFVSSGYPSVLQSHEVNQVLKTAYHRSAFFHKATDTVITAFFFSFIANYYAITFLHSVTVLEQVLIAILSICVGALRLWYISHIRRDLKSHDYTAVGGVPCPTVPDYDPVPMTPNDLPEEEDGSDDDSNNSVNK